VALPTHRIRRATRLEIHVQQHRSRDTAPLAFLVAVLSTARFSYRMGQTCLPNHEKVITTFWVWLVVFAILGFLLQAITTGFCVCFYTKTLRRERLTPSHQRGYRGSVTSNLQTWVNVRRLFVLQWRKILVSVLVLIGSLVFFIVFWTQDSKLGAVFNNPGNIKPVKTWIVCQTLSRGIKTECRKYVKNFTVNELAVLTALILASVSYTMLGGIGRERLTRIARRYRNFHPPLPHIHAPRLYRRPLQTPHASQTKPTPHAPPTPELTTLSTPEKSFPPSPNMRLSGSRFAEVFQAPPSPPVDKSLRATTRPLSFPTVSLPPTSPLP
jgi:hypothetical protein